MRISISTGTLFTFPLRRAFEMAAEAGFDGLELIINQDFQRVNSRQLMAELGEIMPILSLHAPVHAAGRMGDADRLAQKIGGTCGRSAASRW